MGITPGMVGAAVGGGSALAGLLGLGAQQPNAPPPAFVPTNLPDAATEAFNATSNLGAFNTAAQTLPQFGQVTQNLVNNPGAASFQAGANATGAAGMAAGSNLLGSAQSLLPFAQQTLQTGFDPQNALYNQSFQQQTDQDRAAQAARGIATTPYGAGVENQADLLFNTNWENQQLGRQATAAQTAGSLLGSAGTGTTTGLNTMLQGAATPFQTANTIGTDQQTALSALGNQGQLATNTANTQIAALIQYLGLGNSASTVNNQNFANQITAQNDQFNQQQTLGKNLGASISGLGTPSFTPAQIGQIGNMNAGSVTNAQSNAFAQANGLV
jgi:hypothetical protein